MWAVRCRLYGHCKRMLYAMTACIQSVHCSADTSNKDTELLLTQLPSYHVTIHRHSSVYLPLAARSASIHLSSSYQLSPSPLSPCTSSLLISLVSPPGWTPPNSPCPVIITSNYFNLSTCLSTPVFAKSTQLSQLEHIKWHFAFSCHFRDVLLDPLARREHRPSTKSLNWIKFWVAFISMIHV